MVYPHGSEGNPFNHIHLMKRLASHGFVIAALTHRGDALADHAVGSADGGLDSSEDAACNRAKEVRNAFAYMTDGLGSDSTNWPQGFPVEIDLSRVTVAEVLADGFAALSIVLG